MAAKKMMVAGSLVSLVIFLNWLSGPQRKLVLLEARLRSDVDQVADGVDDSDLGHVSVADEHGDGREDGQRVAWSASATEDAADAEADDAFFEGQRGAHTVLVTFFIQQRILHYFKFMIRSARYYLLL